MSSNLAQIAHGKGALDYRNQHNGNKYLSDLKHQDASAIRKFFASRCQISAQGLFHFHAIMWSNLTELSLMQNNINSKGCKYLSKAQLINLELLCLDKNQIGSEGVLHLFKATWKLTKGLALCDNRIRLDACKTIVKGGWKDLTKIELQMNELSFEEMKQLILIKSRLPVYIFLRRNLQPAQVAVRQRMKLRALMKALFNKDTIDMG